VPAKGPVAEYGVHGEQRHGYESDEEVGHRQAKQEVIADVLQLLVDLERHHDHYVTGHGDEAEHAGHERDEHCLGQRKPGLQRSAVGQHSGGAVRNHGRGCRRHRRPRMGSRRLE